MTNGVAEAKCLICGKYGLVGNVFKTRVYVCEVCKAEHRLGKVGRDAEKFFRDKNEKDIN